MGNTQQPNGGCNYRAFQRISCEASIVYSYFPTERYYPARMLNCCSGGLYFESENMIPAGADLCIKIVTEPTESEATGKDEPCRAEVMWCREINSNGATTYGIGVRYTTNICNQCGVTIPYHEIRKSDDFVCLCRGCSSKLAMLSEGKLKQSIENYLLGNVV